MAQDPPAAAAPSDLAPESAPAALPDDHVAESPATVQDGSTTPTATVQDGSTSPTEPTPVAVETAVETVQDGSTSATEATPAVDVKTAVETAVVTAVETAVEPVETAVVVEIADTVIADELEAACVVDLDSEVVVAVTKEEEEETARAGEWSIDWIVFVGNPLWRVSPSFQGKLGANSHRASAGEPDLALSTRLRPNQRV